jgi:hypothetical protein
VVFCQREPHLATSMRQSNCETALAAANSTSAVKDTACEEGRRDAVPSIRVSHSLRRQSGQSGSQSQWTHKGRKGVVSAGEDHEKVFPFGYTYCDLYKIYFCFGHVYSPPGKGATDQRKAVADQQALDQDPRIVAPCEDREAERESDRIDLGEKSLHPAWSRRRGEVAGDNTRQ